MRGEKHLIADDLDEPTWLDRACVLLEIDAQWRLTAERIMDEIDSARQ